MSWEERNRSFVVLAQRLLKARDLYFGAIDGKAGPATRRALAHALDPGDGPALLPGFTGDLQWIHGEEGHKGRPYWPEGSSGVTLDPGLDLGHAGRQTIEAALPLYGFTDEEEQDLLSTIGMRGLRAEAAVEALGDIRVSRDTASLVFPLIAAKYWREILARFPALATAPGPVQTALLSLAYNRGEWNAELAPLGEPLQNRDWRAVADIIGGMQQNHRLRGIRARRKREAGLVETVLLDR